MLQISTFSVAAKMCVLPFSLVQLMLICYALYFFLTFMLSVFLIMVPCDEFFHYFLSMFLVLCDAVNWITVWEFSFFEFL